MNQKMEVGHRADVGNLVQATVIPVVQITAMAYAAEIAGHTANQKQDLENYSCA